MHRFVLLLGLLCSMSPAALAADAPKGATVGGGVRNPWTLPYTLAIVTVPEPTTLGVLGLGCAAMMIRRRERRR